MTAASGDELRIQSREQLCPSHHRLKQRLSEGKAQLPAQPSHTGRARATQACCQASGERSPARHRPPGGERPLTSPPPAPPRPGQGSLEKPHVNKKPKASQRIFWQVQITIKAGTEAFSKASVWGKT